MKRIIAIITMAMAALAPTTAKAQTTPFNSSAASPCPEVLIEQKYDHEVNNRYRNAGWDTAVTCAHPSIELTAEPYIPVQFFNGTYLVEQVPYNPPDTTFHSGSQLPNSADDKFCNPAVNIPYPFYFFGIRKQQFVAGGNGIVTFNAAAANQFCAYGDWSPIPWNGSSGQSVPSDPSHHKDAIYGVFQDTDPSGDVSGYQGIWYGIRDGFPCRKIICSYFELPLFPHGSYHSASDRCTYQIVCYEGSNIIEVHVKNRGINTGWKNANGIIGIQNATGSPQVKGSNLSDPNYFVVPGSPAAFYPSGCNITRSAMNHVAYRFTPMGTTNKTSIWFRLMPNGDSITLTSNSLDTNGYVSQEITLIDSVHNIYRTQAIVSPKVESKYVCRLSFRNANGDWYHLYDTITIGIDTVNTLEITANTNNATTEGSNVKEFNICQGETTQLPLHYTNIQQPTNIDWTVYRILNGAQVELNPDMVTYTSNDTALTLAPDPNFEDLPRNKIDSVYVRAVVDFVSGCTNYDTMLVRIFPNFDTTEVHGICDGQTFHWDANGQNYTQSTTTPQVNLHSAPGCDSVVHLDLTVFRVSHTVDHVQDCKPIRWLNGKTYSTDNYATADRDTIRLQNRYGCDSIVQLDFSIHPLKAIISSSLEYFDYDHIDVELTDVSTGGDTRVWRFPTGVDQTSRVAYYSIPVNLDTADIRLVAHSPYGCVDSTHIVIPFRKETMWMPNAFTPDNPAGNATFGSVSTKTVQQEMLIYNRYGELVFHCQGVDCQWDGRDMNGKPCPQGAYAYIIRYTNEYEPQTTKKLKGAVTLIR